jgi:hypothetical protein
MSATVLPLFPELSLPGRSARRASVVPRRGDKPQQQSARYWCHEMLRTRDEYRKTECYTNMVASLKALDDTERRG